MKALFARVVATAVLLSVCSFPTWVCILAMVYLYPAGSRPYAYFEEVAYTFSGALQLILLCAFTTLMKDMWGKRTSAFKGFWEN